jgi:hypothetical protein
VGSGRLGQGQGRLQIDAELPGIGELSQGLEAITRRRADHAALRRRLSRAQAEGDLPPDADPGALAQFVTTFIDGIAVQASGGASRAQLRRAADIALRAWPTSASPAAGS